MPPHSVGTGTISFGLVSIPIKLYTAASSESVSFNMLHGKCGNRIKQQTFCPVCNEKVERNELVRGYEFSKEQYVRLSEDELKSLEGESSRVIDIAEFVPLDKVDPVYFDKPYYLAPDKGGEKAYHLLAEVMRDTGRCALAKYAARGKMYLVLVRPVEEGLAMQQLLYADEVRPWSEIAMPDRPALRDAELKLAHQLVDQIASETFDPSQYEDEVKKRIQADIDKKVQGHQIEVSETLEQPAQIIDLMEALKASLGAAKGGKKAAPPAADDESEEDRHPARAAKGKAEKATVKRTEGKRAARR